MTPEEKAKIPKDFQKRIGFVMGQGYEDKADDPEWLAARMFYRKEPLRSEMLDFFNWFFSTPRSDEDVWGVWSGMAEFYPKDAATLRQAFLLLHEMLRNSLPPKRWKGVIREKGRKKKKKPRARMVHQIGGLMPE